MSRSEYEEECKNCRPAVLDVATGKRLPDDHPTMRAITRVWDTSSKEERQAFHDVTCNNNHDPKVLDVVRPMIDRIQEAVAN